MVSFPPRSHQMYRHLLELAAIVTALLMLFCLQLSVGQHGHHTPDPPVCTYTYYEFSRYELYLHCTTTFAPHACIFCLQVCELSKTQNMQLICQNFS
ncbi:hypothetical protein PVAP13_3KG411706 [Panicum virgatum]|uniref:Secreted protein n=1 Tax=Panicum virgatum TaxID=38727 RepID=A0A8T0UXW5_PANVG|nr:hypothetical protein PVAP13_3KG411706 [Panicum virgatum]